MHQILHIVHHLLHFFVGGIQVNAVELAAIACRQSFIVLTFRLPHQIGDGDVRSLTVLHGAVQNTTALLVVCTHHHGHTLRSVVDFKDTVTAHLLFQSGV